MAIHEARSESCPALTRMVRDSEAYTGEYQKIVESIEITSEQLETERFFVYEIDGEVVGFYSLLIKDSGVELDFMFVDNDHKGLGIGQALFQHMLKTARELGFHEVEIIAHPPAEAFYAKMGAITKGMYPPKGRVTWPRPHMWVSTTSC